MSKGWCLEMMAGRASKMVADVRFQGRGAIGCYPRLYFGIQRLRPRRRHLVVSRESEIVIEGFPRSANTFSVAAFLLAQERPVKIARHLHVPAQVIRAVQWRIPTLVLIRRPEDAVLSLLIREPKITAKTAVREYIRFYERIEPYRTGFLVATFEEVTQDFGSVIDRLNCKFGTRFTRFYHTADNVAAVMRLVEEMDREDTGKRYVCETTVARPSEKREALKMQRRGELEEPKVASLLLTARAVYERIVG